MDDQHLFASSGVGPAAHSGSGSAPHPYNPDLPNRFRILTFDFAAGEWDE